MTFILVVTQVDSLRCGVLSKLVIQNIKRHVDIIVRSLEKVRCQILFGAANPHNLTHQLCSGITRRLTRERSGGSIRVMCHAAAALPRWLLLFIFFHTLLLALSL
jgi:hypothetical protein